MEQFSAPGEVLPQHSLWEPRRNLNKTANVSQLAISLQPSSFEFLALHYDFNFLGRCFSDRFSIFFIMLVIICSRGKSQIIKQLEIIQRLAWKSSCVVK